MQACLKSRLTLECPRMISPLAVPRFTAQKSWPQSRKYDNLGPGIVKPGKQDEILVLNASHLLSFVSLSRTGVGENFNGRNQIRCFRLQNPRLRLRPEAPISLCGQVERIVFFQQATSKLGQTYAEKFRHSFLKASLQRFDSIHSPNSVPNCRTTPSPKL